MTDEEREELRKQRVDKNVDLILKETRLARQHMMLIEQDFALLRERFELAPVPAELEELKGEHQSLRLLYVEVSSQVINLREIWDRFVDSGKAEALKKP